MDVRLLAVMALTGAMLIAGALISRGPASAQPFSRYLDLPGPAGGGVQVPHDPALSPTSAITIEAWVNLRSYEDHLGGCAIILHKTFPSGYSFFVCPDPQMRFYAHGTEGLVSSTTSPPLDEWAHVAVTYDGSMVKFYVNGTPVAANGAASGPLDVSGSNLSFGYIDGSIDEVRLWNVARSQSEIAAAMDSPAAGSEPGLVAVWHLDGNAADAAGGHDGALQGTAVFAGSGPKGDIDCSNSVTAVDSLHILRHVAGLPSTVPGGCDPVGTPAFAPASQGTGPKGDINCDEGVTSVDALFILRHVALLPVNLPAQCPPLGQ
jgi:hypothetical protein